jgi:hypothetical protein
MSAKQVANAEQTEEERPPRRQPDDPERYLLQIDRQTKRSFKTPEAAQGMALEIKARFPILQVSIYDNVSNSRTVVDGPGQPGLPTSLRLFGVFESIASFALLDRCPKIFNASELNCCLAAYPRNRTLAPKTAPPGLYTPRACTSQRRRSQRLSVRQMPDSANPGQRLAPPPFNASAHRRGRR